MAAPSVRAWGTEAVGTTSASPGLPAGTAENDILLCVVEAGVADTPSVSGYAHVPDSPQATSGGSAATNLSFHVFWKRATSSESAPTVTNTSGNHCTAQVVAIQGCETSGNPWDVTAFSVPAAGTAVSWPSVDTTVADCLVMLIGAHTTDTNTDQFSSPANSNLTSVTEEADVSTSTAQGGGFFVASGVKASAGTVGATTGTLATSSKMILFTMAFKPPGATDRVARSSWIEMEIPSPPRIARVSWVEMEIPTAPRVARVSWIELELPTAPRVARASWIEMEIPDFDRIGRVSWVEMELPNALRQARASWIEMEIPDPPRIARVSWIEMEIPTAPRVARVAWIELELPNAPRVGRVSWIEFEVPDAPRFGRVSWIEMEIPDVGSEEGETTLYALVHMRRRT